MISARGKKKKPKVTSLPPKEQLKCSLNKMKHLFIYSVRSLSENEHVVSVPYQYHHMRIFIHQNWSSLSQHNKQIIFYLFFFFILKIVIRFFRRITYMQDKEIIFSYICRQIVAGASDWWYCMVTEFLQFFIAKTMGMERIFEWVYVSSRWYNKIKSFILLKLTKLKKKMLSDINKT